MNEDIKQNLRQLKVSIPEGHWLLIAQCVAAYIGQENEWLAILSPHQSELLNVAKIEILNSFDKLDELKETMEKFACAVKGEVAPVHKLFALTGAKYEQG